jgi:hypothetical protein
VGGAATVRHVFAGPGSNFARAAGKQHGILANVFYSSAKHKHYKTNYTYGALDDINLLKYN